MMSKYRVLLISFLILVLQACQPGGSADGSKEGEVKPVPLGKVVQPIEPSDPVRDVNKEGILITGARLILVSAPSIEVGWIYLKDGNIQDFGAGEAPAQFAGAKVIAAKGKVVTPGIIDTHSHMGVYPHPGVKAHSDGNEATTPNSADVWAEHSFWPQDPALWRALSSGITTIQVLPGSANLFGGRSYTAKMIPKVSAREMRFAGAPQGLKMACGENPKRVYGEKGGPSTRMGNVAGYNNAYQAAFEYHQSWLKFDRDLKHWNERVAKAQDEKDEKVREQSLKEIGDAPTAPVKDAKNETLRKVIQGEILVHMHCYRADEMSLMLDIAKKFGFTIRSFHHAVEGYKIAKKLAEHGTGISTWADWWGFKMEAYDASPANAAITEKYGVKTIIHSDSAEDIRHLNHEAAKVVRAGKELGIKFSEEQVMAWITLNAAWALGIEKYVGSLDKGKHADIVIWDRHPLSIYAKPDQVFIDGHIAFDRANKIVPSSDFEIGNRQIGLGTRSHQAPNKDETLKMLSMEVATNEKSISDSFVIKGVTLIKADGSKVDTTDVLVESGKITKIASSIDSKVTAINGTGRILTPGLFESASFLGLMEVGAVDSTRNIFVKDSHINASLDPHFAFNSQTARIPIERSGGVVYIMGVPTGGVLSGKSFFYKLNEEPAKSIVPRTAMFGSLTAHDKEHFGDNYAKMMQELRSFVQEAVFYRKNIKQYDAGNLRELKFNASELAAFWPVMDGKIPFVVELNSYDEIQNLLRFYKEMQANKLKIRPVIFGGTESWMHAEELSQLKIPVILNATNQNTHSFSHMQNRDDLAAYLVEKGVVIALTAHEWFTYPKRIRQSAGMAVANGLSYGQAIEAITINPAKIFGLEQHFARLAEKQPATFILWGNDPLEPLSNPERMWIDGKEMDLNNRQTQLARKYLNQ